ncbi:hypothetical protein C8R44DRAFT_987675 [Mycena epipterygia]|nr:hypothetical protein C8R44DRAFT_987675 [Mycena epipterygia]
MSWEPPIIVPDFSRDGVPRLPYTGPPPLNRRPRYSYSAPSPSDLPQPSTHPGYMPTGPFDPASNFQAPTNPGYLNPPLTGSMQSSMDRPSLRHGQESMHRLDHLSLPPVPAYDLQAVHARQYLSTRVPSQPPLMQPPMEYDDISFVDTSAAEYYEWQPDPSSSGSGYRSNGSPSG